MSMDDAQKGGESGYRIVTEPPADAEIVVYRISGFVKWFDVGRGYGFIIPDNGMPDVLLHLSCLKRDGFEAPLEGTRVVCDAVRRQKGYQVLKVIDMDASTAVHPVERPSRTHVEVALAHACRGRRECGAGWRTGGARSAFLFCTICIRENAFCPGAVICPGAVMSGVAGHLFPDALEGRKEHNFLQRKRALAIPEVPARTRVLHPWEDAACSVGNCWPD